MPILEVHAGDSGQSTGDLARGRFGLALGHSIGVCAKWLVAGQVQVKIGAIQPIGRMGKIVTNHESAFEPSEASGI